MSSGFSLARRMQLGPRLAQRMKRLGISAEDLSSKLGIKPIQIHHIICGGVDQSSWADDVDMMIRLAEETNTSVGWLLGVEEA